MNKMFSGDSYTLSSNWFQRYKKPYTLLIFDVAVVGIITLFAIKDFLIGDFEGKFVLAPILVMLMLAILLFIRFNLSLLMFTEQRVGFYCSIAFLMFVIFLEVHTINTMPPLMFVNMTIVQFFNSYVFHLPMWLNKALTYALYVYIFYLPMLFYLYYFVKKKHMNRNARYFDVLTGFYASTMSSKLHIFEVIVIVAQIAIAAYIGILSSSLNWAFVALFLSTYSCFDLIKKFNMKEHLTKQKSIIIFLCSVLTSAAIIYFQRFCYWGMVAFLLSSVLMYVVIALTTKKCIKSLIVILISFCMIPIFVLGYNIFTRPSLGVICKNVPYKNEKVYFITKDNKGMLGIRNRNYRYIPNRYVNIYHPCKNKIYMQRPNGTTDMFELNKDIIFINVKE